MPRRQSLTLRAIWVFAAFFCLVTVAGAEPGAGPATKPTTRDVVADEALIRAIHKGDVAAVKRLLREGADVNPDAKNSDYSPLMTAVAARNAEIARVLLAGGADSNLKGRGYFPLQCAAFYGKGDVIEALLDRGAKTTEPVGGRSPLCLAVDGGHLDAVRVLLKRGAEVNGVDEKGWTALHEAASDGNADAAKVLLAAGADVMAKTNDGRTPLSVAQARVSFVERPGNERRRKYLPQLLAAEKAIEEAVSHAATTRPAEKAH